MDIFNILGPAAVPTIVCLLLGLIMLVIEMFTPGVGISGGVGLISLIAVVVMQIGWGSPVIAIYIIAIVLMLIILVLFWFIRSFQKGRMSKSFLVLGENIDSVSSSAGDRENIALVGSTGVSITPLRPSGIGEFAGRRMDVMTAGDFIPAGASIKIVSAAGLQVLVEAAEA